MASAKTAKKNLVIVESPAKAKTLKKFLGSNYKIEASMGHVRDLPKSTLGVDTDNDFEPKYITIRGKGPLLAKLRKEAKNAKKVYLATDPDREGEAISWHLLTALDLDKENTERISFNEITKTAVKRSIQEARDIDMDLVDSQQARRVLDRIVGYKIGPILWKKVKGGLSAGRVQSVALKLICDRDEEIDNFQQEEYWTIDVNLLAGKKGKFTAKFYGQNNKKLELKSKEEAEKITGNLEKTPFIIEDVKTGSRVKNPAPPFTTSTLQQEASKILGYAPQKTMSIAQQLYEGVDIKGEGTVGLVSYIRTDSTRIADEAYEEAKEMIGRLYGDAYIIGEKRTYKSKGKSQDAHEAIRPTEVNRNPLEIKASLSAEQFKLYKLIWERFVASQMKPALYETVSVKLNSGENNFRASGSKLAFDGYLIVYKKNEAKETDIDMPGLEKGQEVQLKEILPEQHFTQPPARYSEASLIKTLEEIGVGRPSTYAPTISTLTYRNYITKESKVFYTTELGEIVNDIVKNNFGNIVDVDFTAKMEEELDEIEDGKMEWKEVIRKFYPDFEKLIEEAEEKITEVEIKDVESDVICDKCGRNMVIKYGRFGKFLACPGFPECRNAKPLFEEAGVDCPECDGQILIKKTKKGRKFFGCSNHPECSFVSWNKPTGEKCPVCGDYLVEKGSKKVRISCSSSECGFTKEKEETKAD